SAGKIGDRIVEIGARIVRIPAMQELIDGQVQGVVGVRALARKVHVRFWIDERENQNQAEQCGGGQKQSLTFRNRRKIKAGSVSTKQPQETRGRYQIDQDANILEVFLNYPAGRKSQTKPEAGKGREIQRN